MTTRLKLLSGTLAVTAATVGGLIVTAPANSAFDITGLNQQVQHQQETLNNHEARITNNEKDIAGLQNNTGTAPSPDRVSVPVVTTPEATPTPVSAPVTSTPSSSPDTVTGGGAVSGGGSGSTQIPTNQELNDLFASIAPPGQQQTAKVSACQNLFDQRQQTTAGHKVCADYNLDSYPTF